MGLVEGIPMTAHRAELGGGGVTCKQHKPNAEERPLQA